MKQTFQGRSVTVRKQRERQFQESRKKLNKMSFIKETEIINNNKTEILELKNEWNENVIEGTSISYVLISYWME